MNCLVGTVISRRCLKSTPTLGFEDQYPEFPQDGHAENELTQKVWPVQMFTEKRALALGLAPKGIS